MRRRHWILNNGKVWTDGAGRPVPIAPVQFYVVYGDKPGIPLEVAEEAYKEYSAQYGTEQSLARLNERGGFGAEELAILLFERCLRLAEPQPGEPHDAAHTQEV